MAFGFGFNKQKVLSAAEKYVQQGKLQNAITEYEKVLKADNKDLTVANTVGDLYARLGDNDKATDAFKTVGDAYATQGFTVKAIAMYKKISKLKPSLENVLKLAELYTQQGLFNDARAQYLQVAEEFLKSGELENAVRIFQKILEMDPENVNMRVRLAEVYIRLGKKTEAWQIFSSAAESLRAKGSLSGAEEILQRMIALDPGNPYALQMQAKNLLESGDAEGAIAAFHKIADIDSNPDGLRDLLKAYLQTGRLSDAGAIANKLLTVHNDLTAISSFADALMQAGQYENALQVYDQHAERLLSENPQKVLESLHSIIGHVRENPASLEKLLDLFHKAGETTHVSEVTELLAHASVQSGDLPRARDLYQKLAAVEPQNTLHMQNYQQVVGQLGGTSGTKLITSQEAAVLIDELEATAPAIHQHYSDEVALSVRSALTDAELFISYNMPAKALGPLVTALPLAPNDLRLNQRLAALHTRAERFAEAALCCRTLQNVYSDAGYPDEATRYNELAARYEERSSTPAQPLIQEEAPIEIHAAAPAVDEAASPWPSAVAEPAEEEITVSADSEVNEFAVVDESTTEGVEEVAVEAEPASASGEDEIDLSSEWDDSVTVEAEDASPVEAAHVPVEDEADSGKADETIDEIRFYLAHGMPEQALAGLAKLQTVTRDQSLLAKIRAEVEAAQAGATESEAPAAAHDAVAEPGVAELAVEDIPAAEFAVEEASVQLEEPVAAVEEVPETVEEIPVEAEVASAVEEPVEAETVEPEIPEPKVASPPKIAESKVAAKAEAPKVAESKVAAPKTAEPKIAEPKIAEPKIAEPKITEPKTAEPKIAVAKTEAEPEPVAPGALKEFVSDLESSLGDSFLPGTVSKEAVPAKVQAPKAPAAHAEAAVVADSKSPVLGEFVADLESSLGDDFLKAAPVAEPQTKPAAAAKLAAGAPNVPIAAPQTPAPMAASAAASAAASVATPAHPAPVAPRPPSVVAPAVIEAPKAQPGAVRAPAPAAAAKASPFGEEPGVDLAEMFGELKQDLEADVASADEDPETHYNLGIAFREMGLLDEAIGELQKACQSVDRGHAFPQAMQAYTWLAQCFLEKGVPEAAVRWYDRALAVPGISGETRVALNYELAAAYETAGDKPSALRHFMDVYGNNIDYRDVAERIKALKS
jgi:tetratricopeptide (TPR) repeat protein